MTTVPVPVQTDANAISLQQLTAGLVSSFSTAATRNKNVLLNNVTDKLKIDTNLQLVASVLGNLLSVVIRHSKDSSISLSSKVFGDIVLIHVKDHNNPSGHAVEESLCAVRAQAEKLRGIVNVTSCRQNTTTIAFCFSNLPVAA